MNISRVNGNPVCELNDRTEITITKDAVHIEFRVGNGIIRNVYMSLDDGRGLAEFLFNYL